MTKQKDLFIFLLFLALAFLAYRDCFDIMVPADNYGAFYLFDTQGWEGLIKSLRIAGPYLVSLPFHYFFYKLAGTDPFGWISLSVLTHALNAFLIFQIGRSVQYLFLKNENKLAPVFAGILFLLSPYQTEAVLWQPADIQITLSTLLTLLASLFLFRWLGSGKNLHLGLMHVFFILAAFSYESSWFFPGIVVIAFWWLRKNEKIPVSFTQIVKTILLPQAAVLVIYFLISKIWSGHWFWHGEEVPLSGSALLYAGNLLKYFAKFFLLYRYLPLENLDGFFRSQYQNSFVLISAFLLVSSAAALLIYKARNRKETSLFLFIFSCFIIALIPVLPLDSSFLKYIYPDRYGYLPSAFFYLFVCCVLFHWFKKIALPAVVCIAALFVFLLHTTISVWADTNAYCKKVVENFKPVAEYDNIYVLNAPAYYNGLAAFRSDFAQAMHFHHTIRSDASIRMIAGTYYGSPADTLLSVTRNGNTVQVTGRQKETPLFSYYGSWPKTHETEEYKVIFDPSGCSYRLEFKREIPAHSALVYVSNGNWKIVP